VFSQFISDRFWCVILLYDLSEIYTCLINLLVMFCIMRGFVDVDCDKSFLLPLIVETCHTSGHSLRLLWPPCIADAYVVFVLWFLSSFFVGFFPRLISAVSFVRLYLVN